MSLLQMLIEEGQDIWVKVPEDFFERVRERKNSPMVVHGIYYIATGFFGLGPPKWRYEHEIAHLCCCDDKNVNNPYWDFDHFLDTEGAFTHELVVREGEVLFVDAMIAIAEDWHRKIWAGTPPRYTEGNLYDRCMQYVCSNFTGIFSSEPRVQPGVNYHLALQDLKDLLQKKAWNPNKIMDEVLRKYDLIRASR